MSPPREERMKTYPAYKPSRLSWLKEIPESWDEKRARFLFRVIDERSASGDEELLSVSHITGVTPRSEKNITMFMAESYEGHKLCQPGDLVINSMWAWMAALGVSRHHGIISSAYHVYRQHDARTLNTKFLDYLLRTKGYAGEYLCHSKGVWSSRLLLLPFAFFDIPILVPSRQEQDAIVAFLEAKEREIATFIRHKRRTIELLKEQKAALINRAVTRGLNPDAPLKPSGIDWLGDIPAHWQRKPAKCYFREIDQRSEGGDEELLSVSHITGVTPRSEKNITMFMAESYEGSKLCQRGDLVINIMWAWMGALGVSDYSGIVSSSYGVYRLKDPTAFNGVYLDNLLRTKGYIAEYTCRSTGIRSSRLRLYSDEFFLIPIFKPPLEEQNQIVIFVKTQSAEVDKAVVAAESEIALIEEYRASLIDAAVTGKIDCRNAPEAAHALAGVNAAD